MNVVYIHTHDTGRYFRHYGDHDSPSEVISDWAEKESLTFRNVFCAGPTCSPSRAALLTSRPAVRTLQLGIRFFTSQFFTDYTSMFAAIVLTMLPTIVIYIVLHEQIIKGMTSGALKG